MRGSSLPVLTGSGGIQVCLRWPPGRANSGQLWWTRSSHTPQCPEGQEPSMALPCGNYVSVARGSHLPLSWLRLPMLHPQQPHSCSSLSGLSHPAPGSGLAPARRSCRATRGGNTILSRGLLEKSRSRCGGFSPEGFQEEGVRALHWEVLNGHRQS